MEIERATLMRFRNIMHGAPIPVLRIAQSLEEIDKLLAEQTPPERRICKPTGYYVQRAMKIHEYLQDDS